MLPLSCQTNVFFLSFSRSCDFLLKVRHGRSSSRNWGNQAFSVRFSVNPTRSWAVFNVYCSCRHQRHQFPCFYFLSLLSLDFPKNSLNRESLFWSCQLLSTVVTLEPFWWVVVRCWGETAFNNLISKSQFLSGLGSLDCHIQKCSSALFFCPLCETGRPKGLE